MQLNHINDIRHLSTEGLKKILDVHDKFSFKKDMFYPVVTIEKFNMYNYLIIHEEQEIIVNDIIDVLEYFENNILLHHCWVESPLEFNDLD